jgi:hypothetical protein
MMRYLDYEPFGKEFVVHGGTTSLSVYSRPYRVREVRNGRTVTHRGHNPSDCIALMQKIDGPFTVPLGVKRHLNRFLGV